MLTMKQEQCQLYAGLPSNGGYDFVGIPGQYATNKRDRKERKIPMSFTLAITLQGLHIVLTRFIIPSVTANVTLCFKIYCTSKKELAGSP